MKLSAPTQVVFIIAAILALLGLFAYLGVIVALAPHSFWLAFAGWVALAVGSMMKGF